jgi:hypothetical protein
MSAERASVEIDGHLEGEVLAEEEVEAAAADPVRALERVEEAGSPVLRSEVRTAAIAAAGGLLAGAATVAAVRAVGGAAAKGSSRGLRRRRERPVKVLASRSFLVDVHLLDR